MEKTLKSLKPGEQCVVKKVNGIGAVRRRLFDMGITPGVVIEVVKLAPLGDPMELMLRGYLLSIGKKEAEYVQIEEMK